MSLNVKSNALNSIALEIAFAFVNDQAQNLPKHIIGKVILRATISFEIGQSEHT